MESKLFINGRWQAGREYAPLFSPYSGSKIADVPVASLSEADEAIRSADMARPRMRSLPAHRRAHILENVALLLQEQKEAAAKWIALEAAKPLKAAEAEVDRTVQTYKLSAEEAKRMHGETLTMDAVPGGEGRMAYTIREPVGVVAAITPFNFPMNLVAHKLGPALAAGNTAVLKPAQQTPMSALFIAELFQKAGLPDGALNVVTGSGSVVGEKLVTDDRIQIVTFTGSPEVGKHIRKNAGLKKVILELGSNAALIIDDGADIPSIVQRCVTAAFSYQGQICISLQRIYVHETLYDTFLNEFAKATRQLIVGDPLDRTTDVSSLISDRETNRILDWIAQAQKAGAQVREGGVLQDGILKPTILSEVDRDLSVSCQEVFGPVVVVNPFSRMDEAIDEVNHSRYGLQAGVYTPRIQTAMDCVERLQVGGVIINDVPPFRRDHMPYGGVKDSGTGKEGVKYAMEAMSALKLAVYSRL